MTLDRYGHLFPELDEKIADDVGAVLARAQATLHQGTVTPIRARSELSAGLETNPLDPSSTAGVSPS